MIDHEDRLLEEAGEIYADWMAEGGDPSDDRGFQKLCALHPMKAVNLGTIRKMDLKTRKVAKAEGAGGGSLELTGAPEPFQTVIQPHGGGAGKMIERRAKALMKQVRERERSFGKYHLTGITAEWSKVGSGGAGTVYRAWDEDLSRPVALKLLHGKYINDGSGSESDTMRRTQSRFVTEAQQTATLDHPGIIPVHDFGVTASGAPYFTMKLVNGRTLEEAIELSRSESSAWSLTRILGAFIKACEALSYAHSKGVIHRDLKPSNIMLGKFGEVYVVDWGLLKKLDRSESVSDLELTQKIDSDAPRAKNSKVDDGLTNDGDTLGTACFMAPEQALGQTSAVGRGSDIYGMGAILYHILSGAPPFKANGARPTVIEILSAHRSRKGAESIHSVAPRAPRPLRDIVERAMSHDRADRYATISELSDELIDFIAGRVGKNWMSHPFSSSLQFARHRPSTAALLVLGTVAAVSMLWRALSPSDAINVPMPSTFQLESAVEQLVSGEGAGDVEKAISLVEGVVPLNEEIKERLRQRHAAGGGDENR